MSRQKAVDVRGRTCPTPWGACTTVYSTRKKRSVGLPGCLCRVEEEDFAPARQPAPAPLTKRVVEPSTGALLAETWNL